MKESDTIPDFNIPYFGDNDEVNLEKEGRLEVASDRSKCHALMNKEMNLHGS